MSWRGGATGRGFSATMPAGSCFWRRWGRPVRKPGGAFTLLGGVGIDWRRTRTEAQNHGREEGAGLVAAATHHGVVALVERAFGDGPFYAREPSDQPNPPLSRTGA